MKSYKLAEIRSNFYTDDIKEVVREFTDSMDEELTKDETMKMVRYIIDQTGEETLKGWTETQKLLWFVREAYRLGCAYALEIALESNNMTLEKMA